MGKPIRVAIVPTYRRSDNADGGIRRVSEAQWRYLPEFGVEPVATPEDCDVLACHGAELVKRSDVPIVSHCHGLMWSRHDWPDWAHEVNRRVVDALSIAVAHTAPSEWVANAMRRGMLVYPEVVYHGVDADLWKPGKDIGKYVLWNKARQDAVSDPSAVQALAEESRDLHFVSTIGRETPNCKIAGTMPVEEMRGLVANAGVYLSTTRETFGIGILEALACGVPVVAVDWGGASEIVRHGETGMLAPPGDRRGLAEAIRACLADRRAMGAAARADAQERWQWRPRIEQYARLYKQVYRDWHTKRPLVSVVVTCHNLARYLPDCLNSVLAQSIHDWECVVVNDASEDNTADVAASFVAKDARFSAHDTPSNLKLSGARNFGFSLSHGRLVLFLDADDMLEKNALLVLSTALKNDPAIHIAYGHLDVVAEDGTQQRRNDWPWKNYDWRAQMAHLNQLPYAAMFRRETFARGGGYRARAWRAEDADMWCRLTSFGFRAAKATEAATLIYRDRADSKSKHEPGDGDWTAWFPWRLAGSAQAGIQIGRSRPSGWHPAPELAPFGAQGPPPTDIKFWPVHDHTDPIVSVIIPVSKEHERYVIDAVESVMAQDFIFWEVIVVNDTGGKWDGGFGSPLAGCPWAKVVETSNPKSGPGIARNLGAKFARGKALLWLDADDYLLPGALEKMAAMFLDTGGIVYGDWLRNDSDGSEMTHYETWEFKCGDVLGQMRHSVTCLAPRESHLAIGGFDEKMEGWEDWDYFIARQAHGCCSYSPPEPTFVYRFRAGHRREDSFGDGTRLREYIYAKWQDYYKRRRSMPCGKCGGKARVPPSIAAASKQQDGTAAAKPQPRTEVARLIYQGPSSAPISFRGPMSGVVYRFQPGQERMVFVEDLKTPHGNGFLERTRQGVPDFVLVQSRSAAPAAPASPAVAPERARPEFPTMPMPEPETEMDQSAEFQEPAQPSAPSILALTYSEIMRAVVDADRATLLQWLVDERSNRNRKRVVAAIEKRLAALGVEAT